MFCDAIKKTIRSKDYPTRVLPGKTDSLQSQGHTLLTWAMSQKHLPNRGHEAVFFWGLTLTSAEAGGMQKVAPLPESGRDYLGQRL